MVKDKAKLDNHDTIVCDNCKLPAIHNRGSTVLRLTRRRALALGAALAGTAVSGCSEAKPAALSKPRNSEDPLFGISLAQWSLHRAFYADPGNQQYIRPIDFPAFARQQFGIGAVEYVNRFYVDHVQDEAFLKEMKTIADGEGVKNLLIMCDDEGLLGDPDDAARKTAIENHYKWADMASMLGCSALRVSARSEGSFDEQQKLAADGLRQLADYTRQYDMAVIVENHGGWSSHGGWLSGVMELVDHDYVGTLPDFGNFKISENQTYDPYKGVRELMPYARGVSAKTLKFDSDGNEADLDYRRLLKIVLDSGYRGYVGIEFEGPDLSERDGIMKTKTLLETVRESLRPDYA